MGWGTLGLSTLLSYGASYLPALDHLLYNNIIFKGQKSYYSSIIPHVKAIEAKVRDYYQENH